MPNISRSALVRFNAGQMYALVNDVAAYPDFLPGCTGSKIVSSSNTEMTASVQVSAVGLQHWFTTRNQLEEDKSIAMQLVDGPFKQLQGGWTFTPLAEDACKIELNLTFEFSSRLVEMAFGKAFNMIASNMVKAFSERAKEVYGD